MSEKSSRTSTFTLLSLRDWHAKGIGGIKDEIRAKADDGNLRVRFGKIRQDFAKSLRKSLDSFYHDNERNYSAHRLAEKELRAFRYHNNLLDRTPTYPESVLFHFALVIVAIVVEGVANSYFFGQASDLGLLGGFFTAFLVSVANVAISMLAGVLFLRLVESRKQDLESSWGCRVCLVILVFLGVLHLTIAHYRELLTRNPDADILAALQPMFENPFALRDMESLLLVAIGVVISAFGIYKGYTLDDRYPGYGPVYRKWKVLDEEVGEYRKGSKRPHWRLRMTLPRSSQTLSSTAYGIFGKTWRCWVEILMVFSRAVLLTMRRPSLRRLRS